VRLKPLYLLFLLVFQFAYSQDVDTTAVKAEEVRIAVKDSIQPPKKYDPLAPSRAAFYSAVLPGLGQAYNKRYWKIPIIYAGIATGVYFYIQNDNDYDRFRDAYKRRLAGFTDDEFYGSGTTPVISDERLIDAQRSAQRNKDVSILVAVGFYLINIVDANVDAHLRQYNISEDLSISPDLMINPVENRANYGLSLKWNLK